MTPLLPTLARMRWLGAALLCAALAACGGDGGNAGTTGGTGSSATPAADADAPNQTPDKTPQKRCAP